MPETATATSAPIRVQRLPLESGDRGIAHTVRLMQQMLTGNEGAPNAQVRKKALEIISDIPSGDKAGERNAIFQWVKQNIKFRGEYQETLQSPVVTMQLGAGDCDDHAMLVAALLESIGHETMFRTVATDGSPDFTHVFTLVLDRKAGQWVPLDTTVPSSFPGWQSPRITRSRSYVNTLGDYRARVRGMGRVGDTQDVINSLQPLINAASIRLAYGNNAGYQPFTQNLSPASNIPPWVPWVLGLGAVALIFRGGRRR